MNAVRVRNASPGRYADGNGLYLVVDPSGARRWLLRIVIKGLRRDLGLGGVSWVSLAEAREKAAAYRKIARDGRDPVIELREKTAKVIDFKEAAERFHKGLRPSFKNTKHAA